MTDLLDRYVYAIKNALPAAERDDIGEEIRSTLQDTLDDRAATLGHPLDAGETAALLKAYGHPRLVAARYTAREPLVGPALTPFYWHTLKIVIICALAAQLVRNIIREAISGNGDIPSYLGALWGGFFTTLISAVGAVTIIFILLQRYEARGGSNWNPQRLPAAGGGSLKRLAIAGDLALNLFLAGFFVVVARLFVATSGATSHSFPFELSPIWHGYIGPMILVFAIAILIDIVNLVRPEWMRLRTGTRIIMHLVTIGIGIGLLAARNLVTLAANAPHTANLQGAAAAMNYTALGCVAFIPLIAAFEIYREARRARLVS